MSDFYVGYPAGNSKKRAVFQCIIIVPGKYAGFNFVPGYRNLKEDGMPAPAMPVRIKGPQFDTILVLN